MHIHIHIPSPEAGFAEYGQTPFQATMHRMTPTATKVMAGLGLALIAIGVLTHYLDVIPPAALYGLEVGGVALLLAAIFTRTAFYLHNREIESANITLGSMDDSLEKRFEWTPYTVTKQDVNFLRTYPNLRHLKVQGNMENNLLSEYFPYIRKGNYYSA